MLKTGDKTAQKNPSNPLLNQEVSLIVALLRC